MGLIVQKFGGSSVADTNCIRNVARIITETHHWGHRVVVVLSAQGDTTGDLIAKAAGTNPNAPKREMDVLLSTDEQISYLLCTIAIEAMGYPVVSLTGQQAGFHTSSSYGDTYVKRIDVERVLAGLDKNTIVIVTGFQGLNKYKDTTTLGRGGSDTLAVALVAVLHANLCQIYTDVDGVYTADPRHIKGARKLEEITYGEMLELVTPGAQVLHNRSVKMAKRYGVNLEAFSSFSGKSGTKARETTKTMEKLHVNGIACNKDVARVTVVGLADESGVAFKIFSLLVKEWINVDLILQSIGRNNTKDVDFTMSTQDVERCKQLLDKCGGFLQFDHVDVNDKVTKVSIVEAGMTHNLGVAAKVLETLYNVSTNINVISTNEIKASALVDIDETGRAVQVIYGRFLHEFGGD